MGAIDAKLKDIEKRFKELEGMRKQLQEQGADLNRKLSAVVEEQTRLQGADRELRAIQGEKAEPTPEIPSEKTEKKKEKKK